MKTETVASEVFSLTQTLDFQIKFVHVLVEHEAVLPSPKDGCHPISVCLHRSILHSS